MSSRNTRIYRTVLAALLSAMGILIPMFMPRLVLGPMSFTIASHVPLFLAMFISPSIAITVCLGSTLGFFLTAPPIIALRASSHLVFIIVGALVLKRKPTILQKTFSCFLFNLTIACLHALFETIAVLFFFLGTGATLDASMLSLVFFGTIIHSVLDFYISVFLWKSLKNLLRTL